jgi:hypothetical protein
LKSGSRFLLKKSTTKLWRCMLVSGIHSVSSLKTEWWVRIGEFALRQSSPDAFVDNFDEKGRGATKLMLWNEGEAVFVGDIVIKALKTCLTRKLPSQEY